MNGQRACFLLLGLFGAFVLGFPVSGSAAPNRPNVIFILADDLGWAELGSYGHKFNETPNLDTLAARGMRFTQAYAAAPVCSPYRAALLTGQVPARVGITDYLRADDEKFLSPDYCTINEPLQSAGYASAIIGKWHLMGDYAKRRGAPSLHGFEQVLCSETRYIGGGSYFHPYAFMPEVEARWKSEYLTDRLNREAVDFIKRQKNRPFLLYLSHYAVHTGLVGRPALVKKYREKPGVGKNKNNPVLAAMLESIDQGVGMILDTLSELHLADNTIIVFTSDNGGEHRVTSNAPLRGAKSQLYEGGIRVPLIIHWPKTVKPGTVSDVPVTNVDFFPTLLEIAGLNPPAAQPLDGESLVPLLTQTGPLRRNAIYWHYPLAKPHFLGGRSSGAIRSGDFKLIEFFDTGTLELYDLRNDVGETKDLAGKMPEKTAELHKRLIDWRKTVHAKTPPRPANAGQAIP